MLKDLKKYNGDKDQYYGCISCGFVHKYKHSRLSELTKKQAILNPKVKIINVDVDIACCYSSTELSYIKNKKALKLFKILYEKKI